MEEAKIVDKYSVTVYPWLIQSCQKMKGQITGMCKNEGKKKHFFSPFHQLVELMDHMICQCSVKSALIHSHKLLLFPQQLFCPNTWPWQSLTNFCPSQPHCRSPYRVFHKSGWPHFPTQNWPNNSCFPVKGIEASVSINQSVTQSINQSRNQSVTQSISQHTNQSIKSENQFLLWQVCFLN